MEVPTRTMAARVTLSTRHGAPCTPVPTYSPTSSRSGSKRCSPVTIAGRVHLGEQRLITAYRPGHGPHPGTIRHRLTSNVPARWSSYASSAAPCPSVPMTLRMVRAEVG